MNAQNATAESNSGSDLKRIRQIETPEEEFATSRDDQNTETRWQQSNDPHEEGEQPARLAAHQEDKLAESPRHAEQPDERRLHFVVDQQVHRKHELTRDYDCKHDQHGDDGGRISDRIEREPPEHQPNPCP